MKSGDDSVMFDDDYNKLPGEDNDGTVPMADQQPGQDASSSSSLAGKKQEQAKWRGCNQ
jgi:hypothetical protein